MELRQAKMFNAKAGWLPPPPKKQMSSGDRHDGKIFWIRGWYKDFDELAGKALSDGFTLDQVIDGFNSAGWRQTDGSQIDPIFFSRRKLKIRSSSGKVSKRKIRSEADRFINAVRTAVNLENNLFKSLEARIDAIRMAFVYFDGEL